MKRNSTIQSARNTLKRATQYAWRHHPVLSSIGAILTLAALLFWYWYIDLRPLNQGNRIYTPDHIAARSTVGILVAPGWSDEDHWEHHRKGVALHAFLEDHGSPPYSETLYQSYHQSTPNTVWIDRFDPLHRCEPTINLEGLPGPDRKMWRCVLNWDRYRNPQYALVRWKDLMGFL